MAATNDFLPFATGVGANVMAQSDYASLTSRGTGFQSGVATSAQINKVLRQSSFVASTLAQFIADNQANNVVDDGNVANLESQLRAALGAVLAPPTVNLVNVGSTSVTVPAWASKMELRCIGGGGGAGGVAASQANGAAGGGSGAYIFGTVTVTPGHQLTFTVGGGGNGGASTGAIGVAGNKSTVTDTTTSTLLADAGGGGGGAGSGSTSRAGGAGGAVNTVTTGLMGIPGQYGQDGSNTANNATPVVTGAGGLGPLGGGSRAATLFDANISPGRGPGCGGSGAYTSNLASQGGNGASGFISYRFLP